MAAIDATFIFTADVHACLIPAKAQSELCAAVFHGHETLMIYSQKGLDLFKPAATFMEGFALVHVANRYMDVVLAQAGRSDGGVAFTNASSKRLA